MQCLQAVHCMALNAACQTPSDATLGCSTEDMEGQISSLEATVEAINGHMARLMVSPCCAPLALPWLLPAWLHCLPCFLVLQ